MNVSVCQTVLEYLSVEVSIKFQYAATFFEQKASTIQWVEISGRAGAAPLMKCLASFIYFEFFCC